MKWKSKLISYEFYGNELALIHFRFQFLVKREVRQISRISRYHISDNNLALGIVRINNMYNDNADKVNFYFSIEFIMQTFVSRMLLLENLWCTMCY